MIVLAQIVAGPHLPTTSRPHPDKPCPLVQATDVVVCARSQESFRLRAVAPTPDRQIFPKAQVRVGDVAIVAEGEAAGLPLGYFTNRAMARVRVPLGAKKKRTGP